MKVRGGGDDVNAVKSVIECILHEGGIPPKYVRIKV